MNLRKTLLAVGLCAGFSVPAYAGGQAECAIWICLPGGFPAAGLCPAAHAIMLTRIAEFKPPMPAWGSCSAGAAPNVDVSLGQDLYQECPAGTVEVRRRLRAEYVRQGIQPRYCAEPRVLHCLSNPRLYSWRQPSWCSESSIFRAAGRREACYIDVRIQQADGTYYHHREWYRSRRCAR